MVSKKYVAMLGLLGMAHGVFAQDTTNTTTTTTTPRSDVQSYWDDSSKIPTKSMAQYNQFRNNAYPYPAKPRDMWQIGLTGSVLIPQFDVPNDPLPGFAGGIYVRKSLGYTVSIKLAAQYAQAKGTEYRPFVNPQNLPTPALRGGYPNASNPYLPAYKMTAVIPSIEAIFSFSNILFHQGNPKNNIYFTAGYAPMSYHTKLDALNGSTPYNFISIIQPAGGFEGKRSDVQKAVRDALDGDYETSAQVRARSQNFDQGGNDQWQWRHTVFIGGGYEWRISRGFSLGLEAKYYMTGDDYLDGVFLGPSGAATAAKDNFLTGGINLGFNIGDANKKTEPKWFINPLNYIYSEVNTPKHMLIPTPVLPDADGDGVTDQFDQEPNTPSGAAVDSHGVAKDSDGDGVPDYKDKELLTPQKCFPVNADGVGTCPPTCCDSIAAGLIQLKPKCDLGMLPSIQFNGKSIAISTAAQASLASVAQQLQSNPDCKVSVTGHGASDKRAQQLSWDRTNAVIRYLVEKQGISENRFIFHYGTEGDPNTVDLEGTEEEGPNTAPAPNPQYQQRK